MEDHRNLPHYSPLLKNTCVRQEVLDKWLPLTLREFTKEDLVKGGLAIRHVTMFSIYTLKTEPDVLQLHKGNA